MTFDDFTKWFIIQKVVLSINSLCGTSKRSVASDDVLSANETYLDLY